MNLKIGELVEYIEVLKARHTHKVDKMSQIIHDLVTIKKEQDEELDGRAQLIESVEHQAREKVKQAEERIKSCEACFKELEGAWAKRDQNIAYWFNANGFGGDLAQRLLKYLLETR